MLAAIDDATAFTAVLTPAANAATRIRSVAFAARAVRSDRVVAVRLDCTGAERRAVAAEAVTPGFSIELLPERSQVDGRILLAVRIHRRLGTVRRLCLVRFRVGEAAAVASITVLQ